MLVNLKTMLLKVLGMLKRENLVLIGKEVLELKDKDQLLLDLDLHVQD